MSWSCQHCIAHRAERSGGPGFLPSSPGALPLLVYLRLLPPCLSCSSSLVIPHQQPQVRCLGPGERASPLPFTPPCSCHHRSPLTSPRPCQPRPLQSTRRGPLQITQPVLEMGPYPVSGPIDQEWLGGS